MINDNLAYPVSYLSVLPEAPHFAFRDGRPTRVESNTNAIDRMVANLLYNKKPCFDVPELLFA